LKLKISNQKDKNAYSIGMGTFGDRLFLHLTTEEEIVPHTKYFILI